jgi:FkbM family methyltransferase
VRTSRIAEFTMKHLVPDQSGRSSGRVEKLIFSRARRILARNPKRLIRYRIGSSNILVPLGHDLPIYRAAYPQYSSNIGRLSRYIFESHPDMCLVDIGANVGDTAAIVREQCECPILCIEANEYYFDILLKNIQTAPLPSVEAVQAFIGESTSELQGQLVSQAGTASFQQNGNHHLKAIKLEQLLTKFPRFKAPKLLKLDTDGFDCSILHAELGWLRESKPVLFFEYDPYFFHEREYDGARIFDDLHQIGYSTALFYDNLGDYLTSVDLDRDHRILGDLQDYFTGRRGGRYADVAVFHSDDQDLAEHARLLEARWSLSQRVSSLDRGTGSAIEASQRSDSTGTVTAW